MVIRVDETGYVVYKGKSIPYSEYLQLKKQVMANSKKNH